MNAPIPLRPVERPVNQELVEKLAELLERAMKGEITAMAFAASAPERTTGTGWIKGDSFQELHSAVCTLAARMSVEGFYVEA